MKHSKIKNLIAMFCFVAAIFFTSGCLEQRGQSKEVTASSTSWFEGIKSVQNLGGSPASTKLTWNASERTISAYRIYSLIQDSVTKVSEWVLLDEVSSEVTSYVHSGLNSGQIYSYRVRAVDIQDNEDTNNTIKSSIAFEGIGSVKITGRTTATIGVVSSTGSFDEVRVYATPKSGAFPKKLVASLKGNVSTINVTGLRSGVAYQFTVNAYMKYLNAEDGNTAYIEGQTYSDSFGSGDTNDTAYNYRGVLNVQSFGSAPNAPSNPTVLEDPTFWLKFPNTLDNPKDRLTRITWLPFVGHTSETKYKVVRTAGSSSINPTTTTACTTSMDASCVVCTLSNSTSLRCEDSMLAAPPKRYDYVITTVKTDTVSGEEWAEELPKTNSSDFRITTHVPPDYMVLVQRDAANYELCTSMGRLPNPRKKQRCPYTGLGDRPYNSGHGKPPMTLDAGYYDFGYNLFADRYRVACSWTRQTDGGMCGPGATPGDCVGKIWNGSSNSAMDPTIGKDGDVFFALGRWTQNCYVKISGSWKNLSAGNNLTAAQIQSMVTIDPQIDSKRTLPTVANTGIAEVFPICQSFQTEYGKKRPIRRREYVAAFAPAKLQGEPNSVVDTRSWVSLEQGNAGASDYECYRPTSASAPTMTVNLIDPTNPRSQMYDAGLGFAIPSSQVFYIGRKENIRCQSRFGIQGYADDISTSSGVIFSDQFVRENSTTAYPMILRGEASDYDDGAKDLIGYRLDNLMGPSLGTVNGAAYSYSLSSVTPHSTNIGTKYIIPLGLPLFAWTSASAQDLWNIFDLDYANFFGGDRLGMGGNDPFSMWPTTDTKVTLGSNIAGRWGLNIRGNGSTETGTYCVMEAE